MWKELCFVGQTETGSHVLVRVKQVQLCEEGQADDKNSYPGEKLSVHKAAWKQKAENPFIKLVFLSVATRETYGFVGVFI